MSYGIHSQNDLLKSDIIFTNSISNEVLLLLSVIVVIAVVIYWRYE